MKKFMRLVAYVLIVCLMIAGLQLPAIAESTDAETEQLENVIKKELANNLGSDDYEINVHAFRVSKEFLEEMAFKNRQTNWFGYYLANVDVEMEGKKWVLTVEGDQTIVKEFKPYDDTYDIALRNVAIGTGVIVICVTVSVVSGGLGAPAVSAIFLASAKTGAIYGISSGAISGVVSGVTTAIKTDGDMDATLKAAAKAGSRSYMYGCISGAVVGGVGEAVTIHGATASGLSMNEAELLHQETGWSYETISQIKSSEEALIYQQAGLKEAVVGGRTMLVQDIDWDYQSTLGDKIATNLERMQNGYAPVYPDPTTPGADLFYQFHHVNQNPDGVLAILKAAEHQPNASVLNTPGKQGVQSFLGSTWNKQRKDLWKAFAEMKGVI